MQAFRVTTIVFAVVCLPVWSYASAQAPQEVQAAVPASKPIGAYDPEDAAPARETPIISIRLTDPDTQLNLPWFVSSIIDAVNTRTPANNLLRTFEQGL